MRPSTIPFLAVLLVAAAPVARAADDAPPAYSERSEAVAEGRGLSALAVENSRGDVILAPSADGRLHLVVTKIIHMPSQDQARKLAARVIVTAGPVGGRYVVKVQYPALIETRVNFWDLFSRRGLHSLRYPFAVVRIEAQVPQGLAADVATVGGDVEATGIAAGATLATVSGDVTLRGVRGDVSVRTVSGDIGIEDAQGVRIRTTSGDVTASGVGPLDCESVSGDLEVTAARDSIRFQTTSGDASVAAAPRGFRGHTASGELAVGTTGGHATLSTESGDIRVRLGTPLAGADLHSTSGDVLIDFVPGAGAQLDASSVSGEIDCRAPVVLNRHGSHRLEARLGSGGPAVRIRTTSGNLTVTSGGK